MSKLSYRLDAGRAGGCPVLALGIRPKVVGDFDAWIASHPVIRSAGFDIADAEVEDEDA